MKERAIYKTFVKVLINKQQPRANPTWPPLLQRSRAQIAYRFFLLFHSCWHLWHRPVDCCKVRKIGYVFCFEHGHRPGGVQRPGPECYFAHLEMTRFYANETVTDKIFAKIWISGGSYRTTILVLDTLKTRHLYCLYQKPLGPIESALFESQFRENRQIFYFFIMADSLPMNKSHNSARHIVRMRLNWKIGKSTWFAHYFTDLQSNAGT